MGEEKSEKEMKEELVDDENLTYELVYKMMIMMI